MVVGSSVSTILRMCTSFRSRRRFRPARSRSPQLRVWAAGPRGRTRGRTGPGPGAHGRPASAVPLGGAEERVADPGHVVVGQGRGRPGHEAGGIVDAPRPGVAGPLRV